MGASGGVSAALTTCVGPGVHLSPQAPDAAEIAWYGVQRDNARPVRWSCVTCYPKVQYELCVLGAVWFIRRTGGGAVVYETIRDPRGEVEELWALLIAGRAR